MKTQYDLKKITWRKVKGHFKTITAHKLLVMQHCFRIGLYRQGLMHDMSKYMPSEFLMGCMYYDDGKEQSRRPENERSLAARSPGCTTKDATAIISSTGWIIRCIWKRGMFPLQPVQMPRRYVAEMLMDRICASKNYNKESYTQHDPLQYFKHGRGTSMLHPQTAKELHGMLRILDERGEEVLIRFVKEYYLKGYKI